MLNIFDVVAMHWEQTKAILQAFFCGGIAFVIAFKFRRGDSTYHFMPSFFAFALASLFAQQWLWVVGGILLHNNWPDVSIYDTLIFALLFVLIIRARGNVARMFDCRSRKSGRQNS